MTKRRPPSSPERALVRVADLLGWPEMARLSGKSARTVMDWSDPDTHAGVSLADALLFDLAFQEAGGDHSPIFESYGLQLAAAHAERFADQIELSRRTEAALREGGEAYCALIAASRPGATDGDRAAAAREVEEARAAFARTLPLLSALPPAAEAQPP